MNEMLHFLAKAWLLAANRRGIGQASLFARTSKCVSCRRRRTGAFRKVKPGRGHLRFGLYVSYR